MQNEQEEIIVTVGPGESIRRVFVCSVQRPGRNPVIGGLRKIEETGNWEFSNPAIGFGPVPMGVEEPRETSDFFTEQANRQSDIRVRLIAIIMSYMP